MIQTKAKILSNVQVVPGHYRMVLEVPSIAREIKPGQFVSVRCGDGFDPLLRRPFSLHKVKDFSCIEILYSVRGKGTEILSAKRAGDAVDIIGPSGNGFEAECAGQDDYILIGGGVGVAPLYALAEQLARKKRKVCVFIGARTKEILLCEEEFRGLGCEVKVATDDGTAGCRGVVTDLLQELLGSGNQQPAVVYACGPKPMLKKVASVCGSFKVKARGSLEENMACGIGVCLGCAVKTKQGYKRVCKDGPIFDLNEIVWEE